MDTVAHTGRMLYKDEGRDWGDVLTSQGTPKITSKPPEEGRGRKQILSSGNSEPTNPSSILMLDLNFQNCETINFSFFKPLSLWHFVTAALAN